MAAKQLPIDLKVLRVFAYRYAWVLVILTFLSFGFSSFIVAARIKQYSASITIFVDPESALGDIARGIAITTNLNDQLPTLQHLVLSDDFLEPHVIQELGLRFEDIYVPPLKLTFMPKVMDFLDQVKNGIKQLFGLEIYTPSDDQKRAVQESEMVAALKKGIDLSQSRGTLLEISYTGLNPTTCQKIVEILANQCKELLLRSKSQETREALRYIEQQYNEANQKLADLEKELAAKKVAEFDKGPEGPQGNSLAAYPTKKAAGKIGCCFLGFGDRRLFAPVMRVVRWRSKCTNEDMVKFCKNFLRKFGEVS